jgi:biopolymer transport protein ExbB/TolQ
VKKRTAALDAVKRASEWSATIVHGEMKRGLNSLASIAATAPLVGLFGTVLGVFDVFGGGSTEKGTLMRFYARSLSESLAPTAVGLVVGVLAFCFYRYLLTRLENFDVEMKNGALQLMDELARLQGILPSIHR